MVRQAQKQCFLDCGPNVGCRHHRPAKFSSLLYPSLQVTFGELLGDECAQVETLVTLNIELSVLKSKGVVYFEAKQPLLQGVVRVLTMAP